MIPLLTNEDEAALDVFADLELLENLVLATVSSLLLRTGFYPTKGDGILFY